ncbi:hypothetical protein BN6_20730 [Saccharothrix espanaensis DSM 44229]|uniref:Transposase IS116/IS110/IS902 C-terminal domain-containing protein n=1 Tax=Saccharothrix espanaensis (strain ATCC 51144 / DSM 44229 / JCM 9112 / NBRC 15066 / NRRL 15764) TaxID=1179773 RepID=K0JXA9_SACES|nr:hypothetical protein BN6_20730 [Saccharothrix espanaensis DSM 44229]
MAEGQHRPGRTAPHARLQPRTQPGRAAQRRPQTQRQRLPAPTTSTGSPTRPDASYDAANANRTSSAATSRHRTSATPPCRQPITFGSITRQTVPRLLAQPGIGPICAAQLLVTAGDNPEHLGGEAAFAALCGVSPVEHSSGKTQRHRLNRSGDRATNSALWTIAVNRLIHDRRTREYAARRTAGGSTRKEIIDIGASTP